MARRDEIYPVSGLYVYHAFFSSGFVFPVAFRHGSFIIDLDAYDLFARQVSEGVICVFTENQAAVDVGPGYGLAHDFEETVVFHCRQFPEYVSEHFPVEDFLRGGDIIYKGVPVKGENRGGTCDNGVFQGPVLPFKEKQFRLAGCQRSLYPERGVWYVRDFKYDWGVRCFREYESAFLVCRGVQSVGLGENHGHGTDYRGMAYAVGHVAAVFYPFSERRSGSQEKQYHRQSIF